MKKIMFNDKYRLTEAVLEGRKTQTRRVINGLPSNTEGIELITSIISHREYDEMKRRLAVHTTDCLGKTLNIPYQVGEEIAVAQRYSDIRLPVNYKMVGDKAVIKKVDSLSQKGWKNKMFVRADLMPHRIKITNVRVERLQDISEKDCLKEGFEEINVNNGVGNMLSHWEYLLTYEDKLGRSLQLGGRDHKEAFGMLIDKTCGNGTWDSNPYVYVYDFELIK